MSVQVGQILRQAARVAATRVCVVDLGHAGQPRREFTFSQLEGMARCLASQLVAAGVLPGDRVALVAENSAEVAALWFAVVYAGAAVVPLHVLSAPLELSERLRHSGAKLVLHDAARAELVRRALAEPGVTARALPLPALDYAAPAALAFPLATAPQDTALVLYTSGSTGKPKGAAISHASLLLHTALLVEHALGLDADAQVLCTLPLSHSYGCRLALLAPFYACAGIVVVPRFDAQRTFTAMRDERVTWVPAVPTMFAAWGQLPAAEPPDRLRWALSAGAPLGLEVARRAEERLGVEVRQGYGMTEATFTAINAPPDRRVFGSVGKPCWGVEVRIVDDQGRELAAGQAGEVWVRGHNVMSHYLFDGEATLEIARDGWVRSGDVGQFDPEGRLCIVDRIKDLIIRGGYNVYPSELENVLGSHPAVREVAVIGRADEYYGEQVVAIVVARGAQPLDAAALHAFAAERLARSKLPAEYAFVSELPLGPSGKVHKPSLRQALAAGHLLTVGIAH
jgi:long-chain acyl-CoA synthetase